MVETWSPDSQRVLFGLYPPSEQGLRTTMYLARVDGTERTALGDYINPQGDAGWDRPAWSPDGAWFAVLYSPDGGIRLFDPTGGPPVDVGSDNSTLKISWSPDGRFLAYDEYDPETRVTTVGIVDVSAPDQPQTLTEGFWPRWSADGETIAFSRSDGETAEVVLIDADGGNERLLAEFETPGFVEQLGWSPDGSMLAAIVSCCDAHIIDVETGESVQVATNVGNCIMRFLGWSTDSQVIYLSPRCALGGV